jgi:hypothetical protein
MMLGLYPNADGPRVIPAALSSVFPASPASAGSATSATAQATASERSR